MDREIELALTREPDYSESFTKRMESLRDSISDSLGALVYLDSDMNYSASQKLSMFLDDELQGCDKNCTSRYFEIVFFVSSRGNLFTTGCLQRVGDNEWEPVREIGETESLSKTVHQVRAELEKAGMKPVFGEVLEELAVDHVTEMDGVPATVFQVLFTELY